MKCDDVFDVLTRGPFPTGSSADADVELHLRSCHDCRRLAEALRPAVALLHESLQDGETESLPEYGGMLNESFWARQPNPTSDRLIDHPTTTTLRSVVRDEPAEATPALYSPLQRRVFGPASQVVCGLAAVLLVGVMLAIVAGWSAGPRQGVSTVGSSDSTANGMPRFSPDEHGQLLLAKLPLTAHCRDVACLLRTSSLSDASPRDLGWQDGHGNHYLCCTHCHAASVPPAPAGERLAPTSHMAMKTTLKSCEACHVSHAQLTVPSIESSRL